MVYGISKRQYSNEEALTEAIKSSNPSIQFGPRNARRLASLAHPATGRDSIPIMIELEKKADVKRILTKGITVGKERFLCRAYESMARRPVLAASTLAIQNPTLKRSNGDNQKPKDVEETEGWQTAQSHRKRGRRSLSPTSGPSRVNPLPTAAPPPNALKGPRGTGAGPAREQWRGTGGSWDSIPEPYTGKGKGKDRPKQSR